MPTSYVGPQKFTLVAITAIDRRKNANGTPGVSGKGSVLVAHYNPSDIRCSQSAVVAEHTTMRSYRNIMQFVGGGSDTIEVTLLFDAFHDDKSRRPEGWRTVDESIEWLMCVSKPQQITYSEGPGNGGIDLYDIPKRPPNKYGDVVETAACLPDVYVIWGDNRAERCWIRSVNIDKKMFSPYSKLCIRAEATVSLQRVYVGPSSEDTLNKIIINRSNTRYDSSALQSIGWWKDTDGPVKPTGARPETASLARYNWPMRSFRDISRVTVQNLGGSVGTYSASSTNDLAEVAADITPFKSAKWADIASVNNITRPFDLLDAGQELLIPLGR